MQVTLQPSGAVLALNPGERILDGARRLGYDCPQSCRNGNCHVCAALLVEGRVRQDGEVKDHGELYTCIAEPLEDCVLLWDGVLALGELPVRKLAVQLQSLSASNLRTRLDVTGQPSELVPLLAQFNELLGRVVRVRSAVWMCVLSASFMGLHAMVYELVEWATALVVAPELGAAYLGTQGDVWDAHKDMALAVLGNAITLAYQTLRQRLPLAGPDWQPAARP